MAGQDFTTTGLLAQIKLYGMLPANQETFSDANLLLIANETLRDKVYKDIKAVHEGFFHYTRDFSGVDEFEIPAIAHGQTLKGVYHLSGTNEFMMPRLSTAQRADSVNGYIRHHGFWIENNTVRIVGDWPGSEFRIRFVRRPNWLVPVGEAGKVVSKTSTTIVLDTDPAAFTNTASYDVNSPDSPFKTKATLVATNWDSGTKTLTVADTSDVAVDDWVCLTREATIPQIMEEAVGLLVEGTLIRCFSMLGARQAMSDHTSVYSSLKADLLEALNPRVADSPKKIVSKRGLFRGS